jgi:hypothetical protein
MDIVFNILMLPLKPLTYISESGFFVSMYFLLTAATVVDAFLILESLLFEKFIAKYYRNYYCILFGFFGVSGVLITVFFWFALVYGRR